MMWGVMALCVFTVAIALVLTYVSLQYAQREPEAVSTDSGTILFIDHTDSLSSQP